VVFAFQDAAGASDVVVPVGATKARGGKRFVLWKVGREVLNQIAKKAIHGIIANWICRRIVLLA
jgi:hypothetical protein